MTRLRAATALLLGLAACGPVGIEGDRGRGWFDTETRCNGCDYVRKHSIGSHGVPFAFVECPSEPWTASATGPGAAFRASFSSSYETDPCRGFLSFHAEEAGPVRIAVRSTSGVLLETVTLSVVVPDAISITQEESYLGPVDPARLVVPEGAFVWLRPYASHAAEPIALDESSVSWSFEGESIGPAPPIFYSDLGGALVHAASVGTGTVRATLGAVEGAVELQVRPAAEIAPEDPICRASFESCDGVDNDCDGVIDDDYALWHCAATAALGTNVRCVEGGCVRVGCTTGHGDCDGDGEACETPLDTLTDCGACGNACAEGEACLLGGCVPSIGP